MPLKFDSFTDDVEYDESPSFKVKFFKKSVYNTIMQGKCQTIQYKL